MKKKSVVIAFDDGPHGKEDLFHHHLPSKNLGKKQSNYSTTSLIGVICRGIQLLHVSEASIEIDGFDSTERILSIIEDNPYKVEIRLILIDSPTLGGFNPPNPFEIFQKTQIPILLIPDRKPKSNIATIYKEVFPHRIEQINFLKKLPELTDVPVSVNSDPKIKGNLFFHAIGITKPTIIEILEHLTHFSLQPEPLRIAHLLASRQKIRFR